jgi:hypothetical protein
MTKDRRSASLPRISDTLTTVATTLFSSSSRSNSFNTDADADVSPLLRVRPWRSSNKGSSKGARQRTRQRWLRDSRIYLRGVYTILTFSVRRERGPVQHVQGPTLSSVERLVAHRIHDDLSRTCRGVYARVAPNEPALGFSGRPVSAPLKADPNVFVRDTCTLPIPRSPAVQIGRPGSGAMLLLGFSKLPRDELLEHLLGGIRKGRPTEYRRPTRFDANDW